MNRLKTYDATGVAPNGRLFAGDMNALQDAVAAITDLTQNISIGSAAIGESGLVLSRFGAGEARISGAFRTDGIIRGLGGLIAGSFTTAARNAITLPPTGLVIFNTDLNLIQWNSGTAGAPAWLSFGGGATYGTSLPATPTDGQEAVFVDSVTLPTFTWKFRYNSGSTNADKWEYVGGCPASNEVDTSENIASTTYVDLATVQSITLARAGVYEVSYGAQVSVDQGNTSSVWVSIKNGANATSDNDAAINAAGLFNQNQNISIGRTRRAIVAAGAAIKLQFRGSNASARPVQERWMKITPVRVS